MAEMFFNQSMKEGNHKLAWQGMRILAGRPPFARSRWERRNRKADMEFMNHERHPSERRLSAPAQVRPNSSHDRGRVRVPILILPLPGFRALLSRPQALSAGPRACKQRERAGAMLTSALRRPPRRCNVTQWILL